MTDKTKRGEIIKRTAAGFVFKGYSDHYACTPTHGLTRWFVTSAQALAWLDKLTLPVPAVSVNLIDRSQLGAQGMEDALGING